MKRKYFFVISFLVLAVFLSGCGGVIPPTNQSPTASFTATPTSGVAPLQVFFNASTSYDLDGSIISYAWDFKDGNTENGETISHTFSSIGSYNVKLTVTDNKGVTGSITKTITVTATIEIEDDIVYRAFLVGVGDYLYFPDACGNIDLQGPTYNVDRMRQILDHCKFGLSNTEFSTIAYLKDGQATKSNILQKIASTFSGADSNDISYFYYTGHGSRYENTSYLCLVDASCYSSLEAYISVDELEQTLSAIPGTKVVFLDTCYSGGFIGKGKEETKISKEELESFNEEIINVFSQAESKGLLTTNQYKVLTACNYAQESWFIWPIVPGDFDPYGLFSLALCEGCGYDSYTHPYPADGNSNGKITLHEAYTYTYKQVNIEADYFNSLYPDWNIGQDTQVYPLNSDFIIIEE